MTLQIQNKTRQGPIGTAAAIVCFADKPDEPYLLSASHVLAATQNAAVGDAIVAVTAAGPVGAGGVIATLSNWTGLVDGAGFPNLADAAIAKLSIGISPVTTFPALIQLKFAKIRSGAGLALTSLSPSGAGGPVRKPSEDCILAWRDPITSHVWGYGMADQIIGTFPVLEGDPGAPVLNATGEIVGVICGAPMPGTGSSDNATVISPIENISMHAQWRTRVLVAYAERDATVPGEPRPRGIVGKSGDALFRLKAPHIMAQLQSDFDLNEIQAAGIMGNIGYECGGFHQLHEIGQPEDKGGYGWAQWTGPRRLSFIPVVRPSEPPSPATRR